MSDEIEQISLHSWPSSLDSLPEVVRFIPPSIQYAKRSAKILQQAVMEQWAEECPLNAAQKAVARAYGMRDWFELSQVLKRKGVKPDNLDDQCSEEEVERRLWQHCAAVVEVFGMHGKWAFDVVEAVRLTASPAIRSKARENDTPWGQIQDEEEVLPGIREVSTASHGGYLLSEERQQAMPEHLRLPYPAYEEDGRRYLVIAGFPEEFTWENRAYALSTRRVIGFGVPRIRESSSSEHEKWLSEVLMSYTPPDNDPYNREPTSLEVEVVNYLIRCVHLNRAPCVMPNESHKQIEDWARLLVGIPKVGGEWPIGEGIYRDDWISWV